MSNETVRPLRVGSVCSGIGGFDLGFRQAGFKTAWLCEPVPYRQRILAREWPDAEIHDDITVLDPSALGPIDVLVGGTPCQNLSTAGNRKGIAGEESRLFLDFARLHHDIQPLITVWENVAGALSCNAGHDFAYVLGSLVGAPLAVPERGWTGAGVATGPEGWAVWRVLNAQWFGVAQRRRRVFVVASARIEPAPEILLEPEGMRWNPAPSRGPRPQASTALTGGADDSGIARCLATRNARIDAETETLVAGTLLAKGDGGWRIGADEAGANHIVPYVSPPLLASGHDSSEDGTNRHALVVAAPEIAATLTKGSSNDGVSAPGRRQEDDVNVVAYGIGSHASAAEADVANRSHEAGGPVGMGITAELANTLRASRVGAVSDGLQVRRLTPTEYERLQGFPDGWSLDPERGDKTPDSPRYAGCGDAVCVPVAEWIARRISARLGARR